VSPRGDDDDGMKATRYLHDDVIEAIIQGAPVHDMHAPLVSFADRVRALGDEPVPAASPTLAAVLAGRVRLATCPAHDGDVAVPDVDGARQHAGDGGGGGALRDQPLFTHQSDDGFLYLRFGDGGDACQLIPDDPERNRVGIEVAGEAIRERVTDLDRHDAAGGEPLGERAGRGRLDATGPCPAGGGDRDAARQPTASHRDDNRVYLRILLQNLQSYCAGTGNHVRV